MGKTRARTFLCREALWRAFEEMAREQRVAIDDVLEEAMGAYARRRSRADEPVPGNASGAGNSRTRDDHGESASDLARTSALRPPAQRARGPAAEVPAARPAPLQRPITQPMNPTPMTTGRAAPRSMPPPLPPSHDVMPAGVPIHGSGRATSLTLTYEGRIVEVDKERFILGRAKAQADLVLADPNVSRQHAAIERVGNDWFLADLGSTNGCHIRAERVSRRQIHDGDVIEITSHRVRCSLR